ncbi:MAG: HdaA/DnaA family protein, partial [bacterium]
NAELLAQLQRIARGQRSRRALFLHGEAGSGKTHLLNACCRLARDLSKPYAYLPMDGVEPDLAQLDRLASLDVDALVCVDDLQAAAASAAWQSALLGAYEHLQGGAGAIVAAADAPLRALHLCLKDLESRLQSGGVHRLARLSEADQRAALQSRARHKGFDLNDQALRFILTYYRRDTASLFALLERIDNASLTQQRKITVPFLRTLL